MTILAVKAAVRELTKPSGNPDIALLEHLADRCFDSADYANGRAAFKAKRQPHFRGR
jgi:enoyl-CoA hydratase